MRKVLTTAALAFAAVSMAVHAQEYPKAGPVKIIVNTINGYQASDDAPPAGEPSAQGERGERKSLGRMGQAKSVTSVVFDNGKEQTRQDVAVPENDEPGQMTTFKVGGV